MHWMFEDGFLGSEQSSLLALDGPILTLRRYPDMSFWLLDASFTRETTRLGGCRRLQTQSGSNAGACHLLIRHVGRSKTDRLERTRRISRLSTLDAGNQTFRRDLACPIMAGRWGFGVAERSGVSFKTRPSLVRVLMVFQRRQEVRFHRRWYCSSRRQGPRVPSQTKREQSYILHSPYTQHQTGVGGVELVSIAVVVPRGGDIVPVRWGVGVSTALETKGQRPT
ncbi:hypothetical protein K402DRAFT_217895 [Aulographum hederae CBS 113979]|uniref:Uncharacterized protein n=1 Tax=Aulographum hederae CBS 113979 TaxID=1176131 RepID=A0A6G1GMF4_9PEZI|nr:hypothetical protein K402DRAFT_217895 [Aulographum hederae CBS 113979]